MTRPQALEETFEHCAETVVHKLQSYLVQANEYHNKCLQGEYNYGQMIVKSEFLKLVNNVKLRKQTLTISIRQAVIAARRSVMVAYGRPVYRQSQRQVFKSF